MPVTTHAIVAAGLRVLDQEGLAGLTLRRLAEQLEIRAPTLYWHVRDKRELLRLLADALADEAAEAFATSAPDAEPAPWLRTTACELHCRLRAHRDGALVLAASPEALRRLARDPGAVEHLVAAGYPPQLAALAIEALTTQVLGSLLGTAGDGVEAGRLEDAVELLLEGLSSRRHADATSTATSAPGPEPGVEERP